MLFAFRTDASSTIGAGHVMRCLILARALSEKGAECQFICREHEGHLIDLVRSSGFPVHILPLYKQISANDAATPHAKWLGADWTVDARETLDAIIDKNVDWLVVDHYALASGWESILRKVAKRIMVIDDLADRPHDCDFLLDQNYKSSQI